MISAKIFQLEMEDGDLIEVFYEVRGGGNTAIWI